MTFEEYQKKSRVTAKYPAISQGYVYPTMGLCGETGEIAEKVKKIFRDEGGVLTDERRKELSKELGDVLWYLTQLCTEFNLKLDQVASENLSKLLSRLERGKINGDGDNR